MCTAGPWDQSGPRLVESWRADIPGLRSTAVGAASRCLIPCAGRDGSAAGPIPLPVDRAAGFESVVEPSIRARDTQPGSGRSPQPQPSGPNAREPLGTPRRSSRSKQGYGQGFQPRRCPPKPTASTRVSARPAAVARRAVPRPARLGTTAAGVAPDSPGRTEKRRPECRAPRWSSTAPSRPRQNLLWAWWRAGVASRWSGPWPARPAWPALPAWPGARHRLSLCPEWAASDPAGGDSRVIPGCMSAWRLKWDDRCLSAG
jgi:hypothetical protein